MRYFSDKSKDELLKEIHETMHRNMASHYHDVGPNMSSMMEIWMSGFEVLLSHMQPDTVIDDILLKDDDS